MKTGRKIPAEPGSEKTKVNKKARSSRAKSSSSNNGKILLATYEHRANWDRGMLSGWETHQRERRVLPLFGL